QVYLLGQAISFALVRQRIEPLHATTIVIEGRAVAFLGGSAFGKSTLAASFLVAGHRLLTDDLLVLKTSATEVLAYPGAPRIKLFPAIAKTVLDSGADVKMNADTGKLIIALKGDRACAMPVPLAAIYVLAAPRS